MIPSSIIVDTVLTEQRARDAARARALDRPELYYRDPDRERWAVARAAFRRVARAIMPRERAILTPPDQQPSAA